MRNFLAHTDLTNPTFYNNLNKRGLTTEDKQRLNQTYGCVKDLFGFKVNLTLKGCFELEDDYGNVRYIALLNKKDQVFNLINTFDFQICSSLDEFDLIIRKEFKRKIY